MKTNQQTQEQFDKELQERLNQLTPEELEKELDELMHPGKSITKWDRLRFKVSSLHFNFLVFVGDIKRAVATFKKSASRILRN